MHGRWEGDERKRRNRHMWTGPARGNNLVVSTVAGDAVISLPSNSSSALSGQFDFFYKDGRKISVGDCALFKPPEDSPPFVGLIRSLRTCKENKLKVAVNWLYRPAEVKLGKGILLEAAPNEIFFSFHKDEIRAASLLHPCKVAFLPKGVELPSGICSFVCRRVYDITNKRLWWLTDQDYINEQQEEVDQLLYKTRIEMHATVQPGGRSPKPMNGPTSQLKPGSDSVQNSGSSFPSQVKGKKRERGEQGSEPIKRERYTKMDDGDSGHCKSESLWKSEIAKFTERGGLVDSEGVEKLVHLMLPERNDKKVDLVGRSVLAGVVAATDKFECLNRFVQLRGLPVFDEWLQEVHKGKVGDCGSPRDSDKSVEEFLLVLLRALDKLPVNLHALQMCNIGKSVNHLRQHKNLEIQKKARSLVDTWKKRVEAEMDAKSGSNQAVPWPTRSRLPEVSHGGSRHAGISSDVAMKGSIAQATASKAAPTKLVQGETMTKSASASPGSLKSSPSPASVSNNLKEGQSRNVGVSDLPLAAVPRDEKSSSSSQSHNNSQSCSSDHAKTVGLSGKEDARSSTAGSVAANKIIGGSSRHRKSVNGFPGSSLSGVQRETVSSRGSLHRNSGSEKLLQSSLTSEKTVDVPMADGSSPKLVVKISNRGRSPAQSASGGSTDDLSVINSRASSPVLSDKHEQFDRNLKEKNDIYRTNVTSDINNESWQSNDFKEVLTGSDEGDGSPATIPEEEHCRAAEDTAKVEVLKATCSSSGNEHKAVKLYEASFSPMNALIESCVKDSEANTSMSAGDDVGINLLASVAAGEMSKSDMVSPTDSPQRNTPANEDSFACSDSRIKSSPGDELGGDRSQSLDDEQEKPVVIAISSLGKNLEGKETMLTQDKASGELNGISNFSVQHVAEPLLEGNVKAEETVTTSVVAAGTPERILNGGSKETQEERGSGKLNTDVASKPKEKLRISGLSEDKVKVSEVEAENKVAEAFYPSLEADGGSKNNANDEPVVSVSAEQISHAMNSESVKVINGEVLQTSSYGRDVASEGSDEGKTEKADETDGRGHFTGKQKTGHESNTGSAVADQKVECVNDNDEGDQIKEQLSGGIATQKASSELVQDTEQQVKSKGSKFAGIETDEAEECTSAAADAGSLSASGGKDVEAKLEFDLNEGFNTDDGKFSEPTNLKPPASSTAIQLISPFLLPVSTVSSGLPASITVAAAAKGPFVPPEDLLKNRGELGWKGSAATSAFRPAEPRKVMEMPVYSTSSSLHDASVAKPSRPPLDIDLNVPDERILEDFASRSFAQASGSVSDLVKSRDLAQDELMSSSSVRGSGGLDLDLNRADESTDMGSHLTSNGRRMDVQLPSIKSSSGGILNGEVSIRRDFDLNDGPLVDEVTVDPSPFGQNPRNNVPMQPAISGLRINNTDIGSFPSWFPQGSSYPSVTIQSMIPDRGEQPFPIVAPGGPPRMMTPTGSNLFGPDVYRGPVLSSSPAVPFPSTPFQYSVFPFGTSFPLPSASFSGSSTTYMDSSSSSRLCFPAVHSQVFTPGVAIPSHFARPYVVSLPDGSSGGGGAESSRKWGRQSLDLNAGPLGPDIEGRDEISSLASRQLSVANSPALAEEQSRMYQVAGGGVLKRKEPEGGWDGYKQAWQ